MSWELVIVCTAALIAQYRHQVYMGMRLEDRIACLEKRAADLFDAKAFADLQSKVEALRLGQGLRR